MLVALKTPRDIVNEIIQNCLNMISFQKPDSLSSSFHLLNRAFPLMCKEHAVASTQTKEQTVVRKLAGFSKYHLDHQQDRKF